MLCYVVVILVVEICSMGLVVGTVKRALEVGRMIVSRLRVGAAIDSLEHFDGWWSLGIWN